MAQAIAQRYTIYTGELRIERRRDLVKKYLLGGKRVLCGILTAALIMTGINVPELSVKAATENSNNADESETKTEVVSDETTETALHDSTAFEESSTTKNSSEESETEETKSTEEATEETTEKNSDEKKSDEEASTKETTDEEITNEENPVDNDLEEQNNTDGTIQNGDFESGNWAYEPWEITVGDGNTLEVKSDATNRYINIWMNSEADVSIQQTVTNVKGGSYKCSLKQRGKFNNELSLKVKKDNEELASKSLGALEEWNNWQNIVTDEFKVAEGDTIIVEISGKLPAGEGIQLDDILLQLIPDTFTKAQLEELYNEYNDYKDADYTAESWTGFKTALDEAKEIIDGSENDEDKITTVYKALQEAAGKLEQQGISFKLHFYADNLADDDQLGVVLWEKANIKFSDTTAKAEWKVWDKDCFLMTESRYTGWCSIDIVVPSENAENGFEIYKASKNENGEYTTEKLYAISQSWDGKDIYAELVSKEAKEYALKNNKIYKDTDAEAVQRNVTLYVYDSEGTPAIISGKNKLKSVDMETGNIKALEHSYMDEWNNLYYDMTADEKAKGWYYLTLSVPSAGDNEKAFELYRKDGTGKYTWIKNFINGSNTDDYSVDINPVFAGNVYYKNGEFLNNQGISSEMAELKKLIAEAEKLKNEDYTKDSWNIFTEALNEAKAIAEKEGSATDEEIKAAKDKLENAKKGLKYSRQADINVEKIPLAEDFITGADLSSYISLIESGAVFKDENGNALSDEEFFKKVAEGGTNWVRIRVWDNPYDSSGNSYGGGHNDIKTAIKIGKLATQAGMRVLIDFHYSDFWVDPAKYKAPKAWAGKTVAEKAQLLYDHTYNNLKKLHDAGVDVGMVQVGNETNNGMAGVSYSVEEDICSLFRAGSNAVRQFSKEVHNGDEKAVKVAVHFADPQNGFGKYAALFEKYNVDYDVFAASYYPNIHEYSTGKGETNSLRETLEYVAKTYGKQVMVAETSWPNTWEDGDGHGNGAPRLTENLQYDISVQGQADEMYAVVKAVSEVTNGIGVFYWEPAWIPVGYAYNDDGSVNEAQLSKNKALWEKYGSGWASSYAGEYDAEDAGRWFGGSSMDNQSWFDFDGTALPTLNTYSYIRTGSVCETKKISSIMKKHEYELSVGDEVKLPEKIEAKFNDGTSAEFPVEWDKETVKLISTDKAGQYAINGVVTCEYNNNIKNVVEKYNVVLTLYVLASKDSNLIINSGFEDGINGWKIVYDDGTENALSGYTIKATEETPHSDKYGLNFYREDKGLSFKVFQTRTNLPVGIYDFGGFIQGGGANEGDVSYAYVKVTSDKGEERYTLKSECEFKGWKNWSQPQITGFAVNAGDTVEVGFEVQTSKAGSWGSIDDLYIYGSYGVNVDAELKNGSITVSDNMVRCGEKVNFTVTPDDGYAIGEKAVLYKVNEDGKKEQIQECILDSNGAGSFTMPAYPVVISTEFKEIEDIDFNDVTFADIPVQIYTGKAIIPEINAYYKSYALVEGKDYTVTCENNVAVSTTAKVIVTGKGRFKGTKELIFEIRKAVNLKDAIVEINGSDFTDKNKVPNFYYTSKEIKPQDIVVKVKTENGEAVLEKNEDYIVEG